MFNKSLNYHHLDVESNDGYQPVPPCNYRLVSRKIHKLNVKRAGVSTFRFVTWYHSILEYSWWKLLLLLCVIFSMINLFFGCLFLWDVEGLNGVPSGLSTAGNLYICFCFSVQTLTTIGYGSLAPSSFYIHGVAATEGFLSFIASALLTGIVFAKISRPTKLSRQIIFSNIATVNRVTRTYVPHPENHLQGKYKETQHYVLAFRVANLRKSQLCNTSVRLLLLRREFNDVGTSILDQRARSVDRVYELDFEIYNQLGRNRGISFSVPYLALPFTIEHTITEDSPLFGTSPSEWMQPEKHFEIIAVLDAVDEGVSMNVQARWSYLPHEINLDSEFVNITRFNPKSAMYEIDFAKFHETRPSSGGTYHL